MSGFTLPAKRVVPEPMLTNQLVMPGSGGDELGVARACRCRNKRRKQLPFRVGNVDCYVRLGGLACRGCSQPASFGLMPTVHERQMLGRTGCREQLSAANHAVRLSDNLAWLHLLFLKGRHFSAPRDKSTPASRRIYARCNSFSDLSRRS